MSTAQKDEFDILTLRQKIDRLNEKARQSWRLDPASALQKAEEAERLAKQAPFASDRFQSSIILSRAHQANAHIVLGNFTEGLRLAIVANNGAKNLPDSVCQLFTLGALGHAYFRFSDYAKAQESFQKELLLATQIDHTYGKIQANNGLCTVFGESGNFELAIEHAQATLSLIKSSKELEDTYLPQCLNNLSVLYGYVKQYDKSLAYGLQGLQTVEHERSGLSVALLLSVATTLRYKSQFDEALTFYAKALDYLADVPNPYIRSVAYYDVGNTYFLMGNLALAAENIEIALREAAQAENLVQQAKCYELMSDLARENGRFEEALSHYRRFHALQQDAIGKEKSEQMQKLRVAYEIDIAQKEAELLRLQAEELEQQVQQRTIALEKALSRERVLSEELSTALRQSQQANVLRSRIIETVSHEFRTPLTVINTSVDMLTKYTDALDEEKKSNLRERIHGSIFYLSRLLEDVSMVESVDTMSVIISTRNIEIASLLDELRLKINQSAVEQERIKIGLSIPDTTEVQLDPILVIQILETLILNGLKFSDDDVRVKIGADSTHLNCSVTDFGIGILPEEKASIFNLFERGSNVEARRGLGIGLYVAHQLTIHLGGELTVESEALGRGTTFRLSLPI